MTDADRIAALEVRLALAEARLAAVEARSATIVSYPFAGASPPDPTCPYCGRPTSQCRGHVICEAA